MSAVIVYSSKKNGPITLLHKSPHNTLTFGLSRSISLVLVFSSPNSCIMFVKLSRRMKSCFVTKANAVKKVSISSIFSKMLRENSFIYLILIILFI